MRRVTCAILLLALSTTTTSNSIDLDNFELNVEDILQNGHISFPDMDEQGFDYNTDMEQDLDLTSPEVDHTPDLSLPRERRSTPVSCTPPALKYPFSVVKTAVSSLGQSAASRHGMCMLSLCRSSESERVVMNSVCQAIDSKINALCGPALQQAPPEGQHSSQMSNNSTVSCNQTGNCSALNMTSAPDPRRAKIAAFCVVRAALCLAASNPQGSLRNATVVQKSQMLAKTVNDLLNDKTPPCSTSTPSSSPADCNSTLDLSKLRMDLARIRMAIQTRAMPFFKAFTLVRVLAVKLVMISSMINNFNNRLNPDAKKMQKAFSAISLDDFASTVCYAFTPQCQGSKVLPLCPSTCRQMAEFLKLVSLFVNTSSIESLDTLQLITTNLCNTNKTHTPCYLIRPQRPLCTPPAANQASSTSTLSPITMVTITQASSSQLTSSSAYNASMCITLKCEGPLAKATTSQDNVIKTSIIIGEKVHQFVTKGFSTPNLTDVDYKKLMPCALSCSYLVSLKKKSIVLIGLSNTIAMLLTVIFTIFLLVRVAKKRPLTQRHILMFNIAFLVKILPWLISATRRGSEIDCRPDKSLREGKEDFKNFLCGLSACIDIGTRFLPDLLIVNIFFTRIWLMNDMVRGMQGSFNDRLWQKRIVQAHTSFALTFSFFLVIIGLVADRDAKPPTGPQRYCQFAIFGRHSGPASSFFNMGTSLSIIIYCIVILFRGKKERRKIRTAVQSSEEPKPFEQGDHPAAKILARMTPLRKRLIWYTNAYLFAMIIEFCLRMLALSAVRSVDKKEFGMKVAGFQWCTMTACDVAKCPPFPRDYLMPSSLMFLIFYMKFIISILMMAWALSCSKNSPDMKPERKELDEPGAMAIVSIASTRSSTEEKSESGGVIIQNACSEVREEMASRCTERAACGNGETQFGPDNGDLPPEYDAAVVSEKKLLEEN